MCASEHSCLPHTYMGAQSSSEATACSTLPLRRMGNELKAWDTLGALSFPAMLQWISSRPLWETPCQHVEGVIYFTRWCIWPCNLFFDGEELLSTCFEHNVSLSASGLEKGMCAERACPFFPEKIVPLSTKLALPLQLPQCSCHTWMVIRDFQVGRCSPLALGVGQRWDSLRQKQPLFEGLAPYALESTGSSWRQLNRGRVYWNCK